MATVAGGRRKSSSMEDKIVESESRCRTREYAVWLKACNLVKLSAQVAVAVFS